MCVIPQAEEPRWIILGDPRRAIPVLRSWRPFKLQSQLKWKLVVLASSANALTHLRGTVCETVRLDLTYWQRRLPGCSQDWTYVIHVGNASHTRKAILFMLGKDAAVKAVAKVPLAEEASGAILNEATILRRLHPLGDLPEVLFQDEQHGIAAQTWLEGKAVSRTFEVAHIDLLSRLAQEDESVRLCDFQSSIAANLDKLDLPLDRSRLGQALDLMDSEEKLPAFIEHRDFTPWNLKRLRSGHFGLLDWEWAVEKGLPWQDICRFFYEQDFLFQGPGKVWETLSSHPLLRTYLRRFDIPADTLPGLTMHYLLRNLCLRVLHMDTTSFDTAAVEYTVQQIEAILDTKARISSKSRI